MKTVFRYSLSVLVIFVFKFAFCGDYTSGQTIPDSYGITVERCNWIFDRIPDHFEKERFDPAAFSNEFSQLISMYLEREDYDLGGLLGEIDEDFFVYWYNGNGDPYTENARKTYSLVNGSADSAEILLKMNEFSSDYKYQMSGQFHMYMIRESGQWVLDDWRTDAMPLDYSMKSMLKKSFNRTYVRYRGFMEGSDDSLPFTAVLCIDRSMDRGNVYGAIQFDKDSGNEFYDSLTGTLKDDGTIALISVIDGRDQLFMGSMVKDFSEVAGEWQRFNLEGKGEILLDFKMDIWP